MFHRSVVNNRVNFEIHFSSRRYGYGGCLKSSSEVVSGNRRRISSFNSAVWKVPLSAMEQTTPTTPPSGVVRWLCCGAVAGLAVDLGLYPLDTLKTRLQVGSF
jgi:hypothetical protein